MFVFVDELSVAVSISGQALQIYLVVSFKVSVLFASYINYWSGCTFSLSSFAKGFLVYVYQFCSLHV